MLSRVELRKSTTAISNTTQQPSINLYRYCIETMYSIHRYTNKIKMKWQVNYKTKIKTSGYAILTQELYLQNVKCEIIYAMNKLNQPATQNMYKAL